MCPFTVRVPPRLSLADFLGSGVTRTVGAPRKGFPYCQVRIRPWICLRPSTPTPFNRLFRQPAALSLLRLRIARGGSTGIFTCSAIGLAVRLSLRARLTRLTLIRLALIRKPWSFGGQVSRLPYRYLYLHLLFHLLQNASRRAFGADGMLPYRHMKCPAASAGCLCPIIIHAGSLD